MPKDHKDEVKASDHESYWPMTLVAVIIPIVGLIVGAIYLTKDSKVNRKVGEHLIAVGILSSIIVGGIWFFTFGSGLFAPAVIPLTSVPAAYQPVASQTPMWDIDSQYAKITTGMTKAAVESAIGKTGQCTESQQSGSTDTYAACSYGGTSADGGIIVVNYVNSTVTTKEITKF
jgi:hypothetical protein